GIQQRFDANVRASNWLLRLLVDDDDDEGHEYGLRRIESQILRERGDFTAALRRPNCLQPRRRAIGSSLRCKALDPSGEHESRDQTSHDQQRANDLRNPCPRLHGRTPSLPSKLVDFLMIQYPLRRPLQPPCRSADKCKPTAAP